jgi:predicted dehydrogenase
MEEALKAGKPVYVEKPVTTSSEMCSKMIDARNKLDGFVSVAHYRRQLPLFRKVKELVESNTIGRVTFVRLSTLQAKTTRIDWRLQPDVSGGGLFHDLSPHQLDIMYWMFGQPVSVSGNSLNQMNYFNAPDIATVEAIFKNNILLQGVWAFNVNDSASQDLCEIIGTGGFIRFSFFKKSTIDINGKIIGMDYPENIQQPMIEAVVKYFKGTGENPCSLEEALVVMKMMDLTKSK